MIATFSPPMSGVLVKTAERRKSVSINVIVIAAIENAAGTELLCVRPDGLLTMASLDQIVLDFRYNEELGRWTDTAEPIDEEETD